MSETITISKYFADGSDQLPAVTTLTDTNLEIVNGSVAASSSHTFALVFPHTTLTAVFLSVTGNNAGAVTCTFSGSSNPAPVMLTGGDVYEWNNLNHLTSPFPADCTTLACVNADATNAASIQCRVLFH